MRGRSVVIGLVGLCIAWRASGGEPPSTTVLKQMTQAMTDAWPPGDSSVWERYADPSLRYVTEDNVVKTKKQVIKDMEPLPAGSSARILVEEFQVQDFGSFAVCTYMQDEHETIEGHELHARYRVTDTWRRTAGDWRLVAAQNLAIPFDPPRGVIAPDRLTDYEGTYRLSDKTSQVIRRNGGHLVIERKGRPDATLEVESGDVFFLRVAQGFVGYSKAMQRVWSSVSPTAVKESILNG